MTNPTSFRPFGPDHLLMLLSLAALGAGMIRAGRAWPDSSRRLLEKTLGVLLLAYTAAAYGQRWMDHELSLAYSLPLEVCHLVLFAVVITLFRPSFLASEISYFLGLSGTVQALLTPDIQQGFPTWEFIQFFWSHGLTVLAIVLIVAGRGFRPTRRGIVRMMAFINVYAVVVGVLDFAFDWNYGYLLHKPAQPSLLDYLGPWPWYVLSLELVAFVMFWLLVLPWELVKAWPRPQKAPRASAS